MKRYGKYKDSGVDWIEEIPEDWNMLPIRAIFDERNEKNIGPKTDFILSVTKDRGVIPYDEKGAIGNNKSDDIERYKVVYKGDFVINKMNVVIGSLGMSKYFGAFSQVYLVYKPKTSNININFYSYIFSNSTFYKSLIKYCTGIMELRESLNKDEFKKILLPLPSFNIQTKIVNFLNDKTSKINQTIAIKQKEIELLKERRQILIQKAVTKGLDDTVKMKDSKVEWIGEIPEHWEVRKLRYLGQTQNGISKGGDFFGRGNPFLSYGDVYKNSQIPQKLNGLVESTIDEIKQYSVKEGDVFFTRTSETKDDIGVSSVCYQDVENATFAGFLIRFRPHKNQLAKSYSKFFFRTDLVGSFFTQEMNIVTRASLSQELLKSLNVILPPIKEQIEIGLYLEEMEEKIAKVILLKQQEIEKLKEYKMILINNVVMGRLRVS
ncbi:restriction endonuclease subunit S [Chryseobacterium sp. Chry.R1]|uniref:restriction endonuclease subunit S n=1 Tax=Chryseobacterium sp. Chry.R1 TaxID=3139392 RepID=UPI0031F88DF0